MKNKMEKSMNKLETLKETECRCKICQRMCHRPCWGTPADIKKLIESGYEDRLTKDFWSTSEDLNKQIYILSPALKGYESKSSPFFPESELGCTFFKYGKCELHNKKLKPTEGKLASCKEKEYKEEPTVHELVAKTWDTEEGKKLVEEWCKKRNIRIEEGTDPVEDPIGALQLLARVALEGQ